MSDTTTTEPRALHVIAADIRADWTNPAPAALPYLEALEELNSVRDSYWADTADDIVRRFLVNATTWRGSKAREVKAELRAMVAG